MVETKLFLPNQRVNIVHPNEIGVPITERIKIFKSIQVCPISRQTLIIRNMVERKPFPAKPKHQYRVSQPDKHDSSANNKKNEDY